MANRNVPNGLFHHGACTGLRDSALPPKVRVYKANPDGSLGKFLHTEDGTDFSQAFNNRKIENER